MPLEHYVLNSYPPLVEVIMKWLVLYNEDNNIVLISSLTLGCSKISLYRFASLWKKLSTPSICNLYCERLRNVWGNETWPSK